MQQRKTLRLRNFSYKQPGYYFVTACTYYRKCLFGAIINNKMCLNEAGKMLDRSLNNIIVKLHYHWLIDTYVIMPNHIHAILVRDNTIVDTMTRTVTLPRLMQHIKSYTTVEYIRGVQKNNWAPFEKHLWQRSYHDHIIRGDDYLNRIRQYIRNNPAKWAADKIYRDGL